MKGLKKIISHFDKKELKTYFFLSVLIVLLLIMISRFEFTKAKYETDTDIALSPTFAFFIVDVSTQNHQMKLDNIVPSTTPYTYAFQVSNFKDNKKANVDLKYSIEVVASTNLPLNIKLFKGSTITQEEDYTDTTTANSDGVYFRHLLFDGISTMKYDNRYTETYTLWIEFPIEYKNTAQGYAGVIELIDIEIRAEQVVSE